MLKVSMIFNGQTKSEVMVMFLQNEKEQSSYNFKFSDSNFLFKAFESHAKQANNLVKENLALPAYEQVLKAAHIFNLLMQGEL